MKNKKFFTWLLSCVCLGALSLGVACGGNGATSGSDGDLSLNSEQSSVVESSSQTEESSEMGASSEELISSGEAESSEIHTCVWSELKYDDIQHWYECECGVTQADSLEGHYGGTATTTEKAKCELCGQSYGDFATPVETNPTDPVLPGPTTYEKLADGTVNFGAYPQSKVTDSALTTALTSAAGALLTESNSQNWTSYKYYISSSNTTDYMWYQDVGYGGNTYRGVYFTSYRPYYTDLISNADYSYQDDHGYYTNSVYWFAYEALNWTVLEESNGEMFLLCNSIIDSQEYYHDYDDIRTINGVTVYPNNYAESNIRKWLNETFYETAFTDLQQSLIKTTEVDNSAKSTNPYKQPNWVGENQYACVNTNDKIFLLSEEEVTNSNYGFSNNPEDCGSASTRIRTSSDYAQSQGCTLDDGCDESWGLRSPGAGGSGSAGQISDDGDAVSGGGVHSIDCGVVPALKLAI